MEPATEPATLAGGCFWCLEAPLELLRGVRRVVSGYAGGSVDNPSYEAVCTGSTGHAEAVQVEFDAAEIGYHDLLEVFFAIHDPTTRDRQGADVGSQYRSVVFYHSLGQRATAEQVIREFEAAGHYAAPIVTEVIPLRGFYPAEACHQSYFRRNPAQPYCMAVITPKLAKLRARFAARLKPEADR